MDKIESFIEKVVAEVRVALDSGILPPDPKQEGLVLERLRKKYPELEIDVEEEKKILIHARSFLASRNN